MLHPSSTWSHMGSSPWPGFLWAIHRIVVTGVRHLTITELLGWPFANFLKNWCCTTTVDKVSYAKQERVCSLSLNGTITICLIISTLVTTWTFTNVREAEEKERERERQKEKRKPEVLADCFVVKSCMDIKYHQSTRLSVNHFMKSQKPTFILSGHRAISKSHSCYIYIH